MRRSHRAGEKMFVDFSGKRPAIVDRLRDLTFFSIPGMNVAILDLARQLNDRPMKHLGASRRELFERLDRPALKPLPQDRFEMASWKNCGVNIGGVGRRNAKGGTSGVRSRWPDIEPITRRRYHQSRRCGKGAGGGGGGRNCVRSGPTEDGFSTVD